MSNNYCVDYKFVPLFDAVSKGEEYARIHAIIGSIIICLGVAFLLWTLFVLKGEKLKKCLISGGVSLAVLIWMIVSCIYYLNMDKGMYYLLLALSCSMGFFAIVSLGLILWKYRKDRFTYWVPTILLIASLILFHIFLNYSADVFSVLTLIRSEKFALICAALYSIIFCFGFGILLWTFLVSKGKKLKKYLLSGGVIVVASVCMALSFECLYCTDYYQRYVHLVEIPRYMGISAIVSLGLVIWKCRNNTSAYLIPLSLLTVSSLSFSLIIEIPAGLVPMYLKYLEEEIKEPEKLVGLYAVACSIIFCVAIVFWFWTLFASEGKKRKKLWISGGTALAVFALMEGFGFLEIEGFLPEGELLTFLLFALPCCMGISAIVSLGLVLWKCRKNKRAYLVPLSLLIGALILGIMLYASLVLYLFLILKSW